MTLDDDMMILLALFMGVMLTVGFLIILFFGIYYRRLLTKKEFNRVKADLESQKEMVNIIIETQDEERQRIARDLHDSLGASLSATKLFLAKLSIDQKENKFSRLKTLINQMLDESITSIRQITQNLLPVNLERFGLIVVIEDFCERFEQVSQVKFDFEYNQKIRVSPHIEMAIYRIIEELTNNTLKHAKAKNITIKLEIGDQNLELTYQDDGIGFDPALLQKKKGTGLEGIKRRMNYFNADFFLESFVGEGMQVKIFCPINPQTVSF